MLCSTLREYVVTETLSSLLVEDSILLEYTESISIQYFCPFVAIISCGIASCHDVGELYGHTGFLQLWQYHRLFPGFLFIRHDVGSKFFLLGVVCHVKQSETYLAQATVGCHEVATLHDALYEFIWQWFTCLIVEGKCTEKIFLYCIILHKL